jgi:hypothetical protein
MPEQNRAGLVPRRRGRPRVSEPRSTVSTWLPAHAHDRLIQIAKREEQSISAVVRQLLIFRLK